MVTFTAHQKRAPTRIVSRRRDSEATQSAMQLLYNVHLDRLVIAEALVLVAPTSLLVLR